MVIGVCKSYEFFSSHLFFIVGQECLPPQLPADRKSDFHSVD
jgi:hypothetical protein